MTKDDIDALSPAKFKVYENLQRRRAERQGLMLIKARRRDPRAADYGIYMLATEQTGAVVADHVDLACVEEILTW